MLVKQINEVNIVKCATVNILLDDFLIGRLSESDADLVSDHLRQCEKCDHRYHEVKALIYPLQSLKVPAMSARFADSAIARAIEANTNRSSRLLRQVAGGIAASFILLFVLTFVAFDSNPVKPASPIVLIEDEIKTVKLAIESARAVDGIKMTIDLSDNLEVSGYENLRQISWRTRLEKGTNVISLPISAIASGDGRIKASVQLQDKEKIFIFDTRHKSTDPNKVEYLTMIKKA